MLVDLGLINFAMKTDTKFLFPRQRNMNKLFETPNMNQMRLFSFMIDLIFHTQKYL